MSYRGRPADYATRLALSWLGQTRIELIEGLRGPTVYDERVRRHGYGVQHLGVLVDDMPAALRQSGARARSQPPPQNIQPSSSTPSTGMPWLATRRLRSRTSFSFWAS